MYSRLKGLRVMLGKKQDDFAELLGITKQAYSAKERGKTSFKDTEKIILADYIISYFPQETITTLFFEEVKTK
ncbi:Hypothetical protein TFLO_951 [Trichococcus flocculiformis]|uniref:Helix-turn-helix n=1 Tax=Trichococcus flocculiformis TaxID=82803 RepID=A0AB38BI11_9LACT|nr:helix-turn-helix domain-containing protein [Trichococcus flocculiformis]CZQ88176.1 Hypothetical protein TFLO_951 [Trichococcus flocculiformis]SFH80762.1 Helix-turn-helix [Trichococcus flocculiformis]